MKKILAILMMVSTAVLANGCTGLLEKTPDGQITIDKVLSNYNNTKGLLNNAYGMIYKNRDKICFVNTPFEALTDNAHASGQWTSYEWHTGALSLSDPVITWDWDANSEQLWPDFWRGIRLCNIAIKYLPQSSVITEKERDTWVAEARVLRCYYYMQLLEFYGPVPWFDNVIEPDYLGWMDLERPSFDDIATTISTELLDVIGSGALPDRQSVSEAWRVDNGIAYAIRARVLLYNASPLNNPDNNTDKWQRAADAAQDVLDLPDYSLVDMEDYKNLFVGPLGDRASEIIWRSNNNNIHINTSTGVDVGNYPYGSIPHAWANMESPTQELVDCFEMTNGVLPVTYNDVTRTSVTVNPAAAELGYSESPGGDPYSNRDARFYIDIVCNMTNYGVPHNFTEPFIVETYEGGNCGIMPPSQDATQKTTTGYYSWKDKQVETWGTAGENSSGKEVYWVYFRLAEFYLQKAEALCETGDLDGALAALNVIRNRAEQPDLEDVPGFAKTQDFIRQRIRNERRVEYCFEGQYRFIDQRRWKILNETNRFITGMRITKVGDQFHYKRIKVNDMNSYTDKYLVMPVPLEDAKKMPQLLQPQPWR